MSRVPPNRGTLGSVRQEGANRVVYDEKNQILKIETFSILELRVLKSKNLKI